MAQGFLATRGEWLESQRSAVERTGPGFQDNDPMMYGMLATRSSYLNEQRGYDFSKWTGVADLTRTDCNSVSHNS